MPLPQCGTKPTPANLTPDSPGGGRTGRCPVASTSSSADLKAKPPARASPHIRLPPRPASVVTRPTRSRSATVRRMARSIAASIARNTTLRSFHLGAEGSHFVIPGRSNERSDAAQTLESMPLHRCSASGAEFCGRAAQAVLAADEEDVFQGLLIPDLTQIFAHRDVLIKRKPVQIKLYQIILGNPSKLTSDMRYETKNNVKFAQVGQF